MPASLFDHADHRHSEGVCPAVTDVQHAPAPGSVTLNPAFRQRVARGVSNHLKALDYPKLVDYFRERPNPFAAGEFWGKTVRSVCLTYQYQRDPALKALLDATVRDLLSTQTADGALSTRTDDEQPKSSDLWERKYALLGLEAYYQIEPLPEVFQAMVRMADHTLSQVGPAPKTRIVDTGWAFEGIESSTILEPMLALYRLTGYTRYLDFARYIVEQEGGCKRGSIFEAALDGVAPKDIGGNGQPKESIAKAYEMMSCFEGLAEFYRLTGDERWKLAVVRFYESVRDREITLLGSGGGDRPFNLGPGIGEQWNDLATEQTNPDMDLMMETCVTVTWMKFCHHMLRLTGDPKIADQIETTIYNALAGAQSQSGHQYDYFQKFNGTRGSKDNFASDISGFKLSCCTANGPIGLALVPFTAVMVSDRGPVVNLYCFETAEVETSTGGSVRLALTTDYPRTGKMTLTVTPREPETFALRLRIPAWSEQNALRVNDEMAPPPTPGTYATLKREWRADDRIELDLDLRCRLVPSPQGSHRGGGGLQALVRGPVVLARDRRLGGDIFAPVSIRVDGDGFVPLDPVAPSVGEVGFLVPATDGSVFPVIDYATAGNTRDAESEFCTWMPFRSR